MITAEMINKKFGTWVSENIQVRLLGVRGFDPDMGERDKNDLNIYDDYIFLVHGERVHGFRASVDPGKYWLDNPMNENGCAKLLTGFYWYTVGIHRGHTALVQDGGVDIERIDPFGNVLGTEKNAWIGLNIHSGGDQATVDRWSAGCQVIHSPDGGWGEQWITFINLTLSAMNKHGQKRIPYLLCESSNELNINNL
jgi:hypothetical protein